MKKFNVWIYYHGCYNTEVMAENEDKAIEIARDKANSLNDTDFLHAIEVIEDGTDIELSRD